MVVSVILGILKVIGITLLCILGLIILLLCIVLFVPIRYKVIAQSDINDVDKMYHLTAKATWLLGLVRGKYEYPSDDGLVVKVGPFTVYGGKEKTNKEKKTKSAGKEKKQKNAKEELTENTSLDEAVENTIIENENLLWEEDFDNKSPENEKRKSLKEKILYTWEKICDKINKIRTKIKTVFSNIKKYAEILQSSEFKEAFALCKNSLIRLFRMIKPRKLKVNGTIGMKSPDQTGYVCAIIGVISPFFKKQIHEIGRAHV